MRNELSQECLQSDVPAWPVVNIVLNSSNRGNKNDKGAILLGSS